MTAMLKMATHITGTMRTNRCLAKACHVNLGCSDASRHTTVMMNPLMM